MKKIWDFIRKLFSRSKPTKPSLSPRTDKPIDPAQTPAEGQTCTKEGEKVDKPISTSSTSTLNGSSTKNNIENEKGSKEPTTPQHDTPQTNDKNNTAGPTGPKDKDPDKEPPNIGDKRGGQDDGSRKQKDEPIIPEPEQDSISKPELICQEQADAFYVILSVPPNYNVKCVEQSGERLQSNSENKYTITDLSQLITLTKTDGFTEEFPLLCKEKYMIFKTRNNWKGTGRYIKNLTQGFFVVIAPKHWHRESKASVEPARCSDKKYLVHFFEIDGDKSESISFFDECKRLPLRKNLFLEGTAIQDDSKQGKLFIQRPPAIKKMMSEEEIVWVRVGSGRDSKPIGWSKNFKLSEKKLEDVLENRCGHFFLRVYNKKVDLIDSTEFRYHSDLFRIQIDGHPYSPNKPLPPPRDGYQATHLEFIGQKGQLLQEGQIDSSEKGDTVWTLKSESGQGKVKVVINLPRIRWQLSPINDKWSDRPIIMTRERFQYLSHSGVKLRLCVPRYIRKVNMGFNENLDQTISTKEGISLTSFVDYNEIAIPQSNRSYLQFAWNDILVTAITIKADELQTKHFPDILELKLRPIVKGNRGLSRQGKGFSRGELELVNINITRKVSNIYIDHRRKTVHQSNVDTLKGFADAAGK